MRQTKQKTMFSQFSDDRMEDHLEEFHNLNYEPIKFYKTEQIIQLLRNDIKEICEIYCIEYDQALVVLNHYRFSTDKLQSEFGLEKEEVLSKLHVNQASQQALKRTRSATRRTKKTIICRSCYMESDECESLECGHEFCVSCWKMYLVSKFDEDYLFVPCMESGCRSPALDSFIVHKFSDDSDQLHKYYLKLSKRYIDEHQQQSMLHIKWCPGTDCDYSVQSVIFEDQTIICPMGHQWCFICRNESHKPVSCQIVQRWNELLDSSDETVKWILQNTKLCPFCKKPVEKNQGCHFMNCRPPGGCGKNFCYVCNQPWEPTHSDHFKCPFEHNQAVANTLQMKVDILSTYNVHYQQFAYSNQLCAVVKDTMLPAVPKAIDSVVAKLPYKPQNLVFISEALHCVYDAQLSLKWTYCLTHFMEEATRFSKELCILQGLQSNLSLQINQLKEIVQNKLLDKVNQNSDRTIKDIDVTTETLDALKSDIVQNVQVIHKYKKLISTEIEKGDFFSTKK